ncbi:MAG: hypothetical protein FJ090_16920 [Deltaproteobacteria bacterium]|nr:hypothetical protein [Deltaproteobacteria bacterium]
MTRDILATLAGLVAGNVLNFALVMLNSSGLFPMPPGVDFNNEAGFAEYIRTLPVAAFLVVLVAHSAQAAGGAWLASRLAQTRDPAWMWVDVPFNLACAHGAWQLALKSR